MDALDSVDERRNTSDNQATRHRRMTNVAASNQKFAGKHPEILGSTYAAAINFLKGEQERAPKR
jgi:hypothetical protein